MKWEPSGHRGEFTCEHGVGHGPHIHGCDGCCNLDDYPYKDFPQYLRKLARPGNKVLTSDLKWACILAANMINRLQNELKDCKNNINIGDVD